MNRVKKNFQRSGSDNIVYKCKLCSKTFLNENNLADHSTICTKYKNLLNKKELKHATDTNLQIIEYTNKLSKKKEKIRLLRTDLSKYESHVVFPPLCLNSVPITVKNISEIDLSGICNACNTKFKLYLSSPAYKLYMEFLNQPNAGLTGLNGLDNKEIRYYGNIGFALKLAEWISPDVYIEVILWVEKCIEYFERRLKKDKTIINMRTISTNGSNIEVRKTDGYIDAVGMCRAWGKYFSHYKKDKNNVLYLKYLADSTLISIDELIMTNVDGKISSFIHRKVAVHLAHWISPKCFIDVSNWLDRFEVETNREQIEALSKDNQILASKFRDINEKVMTAGKIAKDSIHKFNSFYNSKELNRELKGVIDEMELMCALEISNTSDDVQDFIWVENKGINTEGKYMFKYWTTTRCAGLNSITVSDSKSPQRDLFRGAEGDRFSGAECDGANAPTACGAKPSSTGSDSKSPLRDDRRKGMNKERITNMNKKEGECMRRESIFTTIINNSRMNGTNPNNIIMILKCSDVRACSDKFNKYIIKNKFVVDEDSFLFFVNDKKDLFNIVSKLKRSSNGLKRSSNGLKRSSNGLKRSSKFSKKNCNEPGTTGANVNLIKLKKTNNTSRLVAAGNRSNKRSYRDKSTDNCQAIDLFEVNRLDFELKILEDEIHKINNMFTVELGSAEYISFFDPVYDAPCEQNT